MKKAIKLTTIFISVVLLCIAIISCGKDSQEIPAPATGISVSGMSFNDGIYKTSVSSSIEKYDLKSVITLADGASLTVSNTESFDNALNASELPLSSGDNLFYIKVVDAYSNYATYQVNIYRKHIYTVKFNTNGGTPIEPKEVEEGGKIDNPNSSKLGYTLTWDFDFNKKIESSFTANAIWTANDYKITVNIDQTLSDIDVKFDGEYDLTELIPQKTGYDFVGWSAVYGEGDTAVKVDFPTSGQYIETSNVTIVPEFKPIEYSISYAVKDGINPNTIKTFTIEDVIELLPASWKTDEKRFVGWYTTATFEENSKITSISGIAHNVELWAKFEDVIFTTEVSLIVDGNVIKTEQFTYNSTYSLTAPEPQKGYVFAGWYNDQVKVDLTGIWKYKDSSLELVAHFDERINDIEYHLNGGINSEENPSTYNVEMGTVELKDPLAFGNHIFLGWFTDSEYKNQITELTVDNVTEQMDIYAKWQFVSNVTFDANDGVCEVEGDTYYFGESVTLPIPQKSGSLFDGWYFEEEYVLDGEWKYKQDLTLVARWTPTTIAINYYLNGGTQNPENPLSFDVFTGKIQLLDPTKDNSFFIGWYTDAEYTNKITEIDTDTARALTLYAKWIDEEIDVTYDANGGFVSKANDIIVYGFQYALPTPELLGCEFVGWYYGEEQVALIGEWSILAENVVLTARWETTTYKIEYDLGGITVDTEFVTEYTVNSADIKLPTLTNDTYLFLGWRNSDGIISQSITITSGSVGDRSFKAVWLSRRDSNGFVFDFEGDHMVCVNFTRAVDSTRALKLPKEYGGYPVTAIGTRAFSDFGKKFGESEYKNYNYYYTIYIPTSIKIIQADAFADCSGMCVMLYLDSGKIVEDIKNTSELNSLLAWEATMTYSIVENQTNTNEQVRDCIWGFRPAIGWSRYSAVEIPDYYYDKKN